MIDNCPLRQIRRIGGKSHARTGHLEAGMGWAQKFLGKGSKEMWVYSENDKHRHEAALITKVEKWLDKEHAASAPWKVVTTTYTTQYEKIAKIPASQNKTEDVMYLAKKHGP